jgi:thiol:disulfide interchange protein
VVGPGWWALSNWIWLVHVRCVQYSLVGGAFAFGWAPCVGPILGSILLLASTNGSALSGALLLAIFSLGLALPFLLISLGISNATTRIASFFAWLSRYRVVVLGTLGVAAGALLNVVVLVLARVDVVSLFFGPLSKMVMWSGWCLPLLSGVTLGLIAWRKDRIDVLGVAGGLFLVLLGLLLLTNSFEALVAYSFQAFDFLNYEAFLIEYL